MRTSVKVLAIISLVGLVGIGAMGVLAQPATTALPTPSAIERIAPPPLAQHVWDVTVPGATPRPGASITGPIKIGGVLALALKTDWLDPAVEAAQTAQSEPPQTAAPAAVSASASPRTQSTPATHVALGTHVAGDVILDPIYSTCAGSSQGC